MQHKAFIGLGSNLAQPVHQLKQAVERIQSEEGIECVRLSSFYTSAPIGDEYQGQPDYVNAVACLRTRLSPRELLGALLKVERESGRTREKAFAARILDLDLLLYENQVLNEAGLQVPHPRMHERAFVLEPLFEISPDAFIPGHGAVVELRKMCQHQRLHCMEPA